MESELIEVREQLKDRKKVVVFKQESSEQKTGSVSSSSNSESESLSKSESVSKSKSKITATPLVENESKTSIKSESNKS